QSPRPAPTPRAGGRGRGRGAWGRPRTGSPHRRRARRRPSSNGRELQVQLREPAEHPGRFVAEATRVRGAVVLVGPPDVAHAVEDALETDAALGARQGATRAGMGAPPEGDVGLGIRT